MELVIILVLILINGIFSMSEMALVSSRKNRLEIAAKKGNSSAKTALKLANEPNNFLSTVQIGITLIGILTGIFSGDKVTADAQNLVAQVSFLAPYSKTIGMGTVLFFLTFFSLILGELVPKRIGLNYPEKIAKMVAIPMEFVSKITMPFVWLLTKTTDFILNVLNIKPTADGKVTEEEIRSIIKGGAESGEVQEIEQDIVERVFNVGDRKINSLMTHRKYITYLEVQHSREEVKAIVKKEMHSYYPVCDDNLDHVIGMVSLKDLFVLLEEEVFDLNSIIRPTVYLIEHTSAYNALDQFKKSKIHQALVTDEFGVVQGILSLSDILEALVGDVSEFHDDEFKLQHVGERYWIVDGFYPLHDMLAYFELDDLLVDYDVTTVSGMMMKEMSYIPRTGEKLIWNKMELEVLASDGLRIEKIGIRLLKEIN